MPEIFKDQLHQIVQIHNQAFILWIASLKEEQLSKKKATKTKKLLSSHCLGRQDNNGYSQEIVNFCKLGLTLKSHYLCFFDFCDNFKNAHTFSTTGASQDYHTGIWFLENSNIWLTTDASCKLYQWDLMEEQTIGIFQSKLLNNTINECVEVVHLKMIATASLDKQILLWDIENRVVKIQINLKDEGGVHTLIYSEWYQVLLSCGYSKNISIHQITPLYFDVSLVGKLEGHTSMLTSITMIGKTPLLVSSDDVGTIKLWDIRTFACLQNLNFGKKTSILKLIDLADTGHLCFLGSRVNMIEFDNFSKKKDIRNSENYPICIEFNVSKNQLIIASKKDVQQNKQMFHFRFINIFNGRAEKLITGLLNELEDEITQFKSTNHFNRFLLGDSRGNISIHSLQNGEKLKQLRGHTYDIGSLKLDIVNQLIISTGWDQMIIQKVRFHSILILKETLFGGELIREVSRIQNGKEVIYIQISLHHNLILTASNADVVSLWDYELFRLLGEIKVEGDVTCLEFLHHYSVIIIGSNADKIFLLAFQIREQSEAFLTTIAIIDLFQIHNPTFKPQPLYSAFTPSPKMLLSGLGFKNVKSISEKDLFMLTNSKCAIGPFSFFQPYIADPMRESEYPTQMIVSSYHSDQKIKELELLIGSNNGNIYRFDLKGLIEYFDLPSAKGVYERINYNPLRNAKEDYISQSDKNKREIFSITNFVEENFQSIILSKSIQKKQKYFSQREITIKEILGSKEEYYLYENY